MEKINLKSVQDTISSFTLPAYQEIPNVGLFLEQVSKYIAEYTEPLGSVALTGSMISNYVKKGILRNPVKKQYDREQIAYLFFIAIAKTVLSLEDVQQMLLLQQQCADPEKAYECFRRELKETLLLVYGAEGEKPKPGKEELSYERSLLQSVIITIAYKAYLDSCFQVIKE